MGGENALRGDKGKIVTPTTKDDLLFPRRGSFAICPAWGPKNPGWKGADCKEKKPCQGHNRHEEGVGSKDLQKNAIPQKAAAKNEEIDGLRLCACEGAEKERKASSESFTGLWVRGDQECSPKIGKVSRNERGREEREPRRHQTCVRSVGFQVAPCELRLAFNSPGVLTQLTGVRKEKGRIKKEGKSGGRNWIGGRLLTR